MLCAERRRSPAARHELIRDGGYVELHAHSAYSFLDGASLPEELAARAAELGYDALALTDHDGVYGSLEFAQPPSTSALRAITGAEVTLASGGAHVTLLCESRRGYENLCRILTDAHARTRAEGRERELLPPATTVELVAEHAEGLVCLSGCARHGLAVIDPNAAARLAQAFPGAFYVELQRPLRARRRPPERRARRARRRRSASRPSRPATSTPTIRAACRLQDALVAIRNRTSLDGSERERRGNHESVLLPPAGGRRAAARRRRGPDARDRRPLHLRPHRGARLPLPRLLRRPRPRRQAAARALRAGVRRALRGRERPQEARPRPARDRAAR